MQPRPTRRQLLASAGGATGLAALVSGQGGNTNGNLYGGAQQLEEAFKVSERMWIGPDSAKSSVDPEAGSVYIATNTNVDYYGDGDVWTIRGVGSSQQPVPTGNFESVQAESLHTESRDPDVVLRRDGNTVIADGPTGTIDERTGEPVAVANSVFDHLGSDEERQRIVSFKGNFDWEKQLDIPSWIYLDLRGAYLKAQSSMSDDSWMLHTTTETEQTMVRGGTLDGARNESWTGSLSDPGGFFQEGSDESGLVQEHRNLIKGTNFVYFSGEEAARTESRRAIWENVSISNSRVHGLLSQTADATFIDLHVEEVGGRGIRLQRGFNHLYRPIADECGAHGISIEDLSRNTMIYGGYSEHCGEEGVYCHGSGSDGQHVLQNHMLIENGQSGGAPAITLETDRNTVRDCRIYDDAEGGSPTQEEAVRVVSGATGNIIEDCDWQDNPAGGVVDNGTRTLVDGVGQESASAETPSSSWPVGATVDFTDSGDGSGTGVYRKLQDGSWVAIA